jgi:hypothetical protein
MDTSKEELDIGNVAMNSLGEVGVIEQKSTLCRARACGFIYYGHRIDDQMRHWQGSTSTSSVRMKTPTTRTAERRGQRSNVRR